MNYIIFDLELNSKAFKSALPNEIIEIGAVKLDENLQTLDAFQAFVQPKIFKKLFPIVKRKTCITQADVNSAESFKSVLKDFKEWVGEDYILCSWGQDDIHHFKTNCKLNRIGIDWLKNHADIQKQLSKLHNLPLGQRFRLESALELLGIVLEEELHRAYVDAKYTAMIFIQVFDKLDLKTHAANTRTMVPRRS
jgi:3'-5' exoribonuclease 1